MHDRGIKLITSENTKDSSSLSKNVVANELILEKGLLFWFVNDFFEALKTRGRVFFKEGEKDVGITGPENPIDPGGTCYVSGRMNNKVVVFRCVTMIMVEKKQFDVPFDPGGIDPELKLENEFFRRRGV